MSQDVFSQLNALKDSPEAGWVSSSEKEDARAALMEAISHRETADDTGYTLGDAVEYYRWMFRDFVSKPLVVGVAVFVVLIGGSMTSVNAASSSLPGDRFYSLKLVAERAQLQLASEESRAILHTEFAQRRYEEVLAIAGSPEREAYVEKTFDAFKEQINSANSSLQGLKDSGNEDAVEVANAVDKKITALNAVIEDTAVQDSEDVTQTTVALETTQETEKAVVDVIVGEHEDKGIASNITTTELEMLFRSDYADIQARKAFDLGRIAVIEETLASGDEALVDFELPIAESVNVLAYEVEQTSELLGEALNFVAAGGYRSAFDLLNEANASLLNIENRIALVEIGILDAFAKEIQEAEEVTEEPAESPIEEALIDETINETFEDG